MKHLWSIVCEKVIVEANTGNLSIIGIADSVNFVGEFPEERPFLLPLRTPLQLISCWLRDCLAEAQTVDALMRIKTPDGATQREVQFEVDFADKLGTYSIGEVGEIPFTSDGVYHFEICVTEGDDWRKVGTVALEIACIQPAESSETT